MMVKLIYVDTSVMGGRFDTEFAEDTIPFFEAVVKGQIKIIISDLLEAELLRAPDQVRNFLKSIPVQHIESVHLSEEAAQLAEQYIQAKVVGQTSRADCQHIAMATIAKANVLVS